MDDLGLMKWAVVGLCAVMIGASKTGLPGLGILVVPLMAYVFPASKSVGIVLGILIIGDLFAVIYHHRNANWMHLIKLLPIAFVGLVAGSFIMKMIGDKQLRPIIGTIVLVLLVLNYWMKTKGEGKIAVAGEWWFAVIFGFLAGVTTIMANAAGPIMILYLLAMKLERVEFVGTAAWFFFIVNWLKVPFLTNLDLINAESVKINLTVLPLVLLGAFLGMAALKRIPEKVFSAVVQILSAIAAVKLLF